MNHHRRRVPLTNRRTSFSKVKTSFRFQLWNQRWNQSDQTNRESASNNILSKIPLFSRLCGIRRKNSVPNPRNNNDLNCNEFSSNCDLSVTPLTPTELSPSYAKLNLVPSSSPHFINQRNAMSCEISRLTEVLTDSPRSDYYHPALSMDVDRYLSNESALMKLRAIQSFDDMIQNGFEMDPNLPRTPTVSFSLTPVLQSDTT